MFFVTVVIIKGWHCHTLDLPYYVRVMQAFVFNAT